MRALLVVLGLLLLLAGGAVAAARFALVDLAFLDAVPQGRELLASPLAPYAGGGGAGLGLLMIILVAATGGRRHRTAPLKAKASVSPQTRDTAPSPAAPVASPSSHRQVDRSQSASPSVQHLEPGAAAPPAASTASASSPLSPPPSFLAKPTASAEPPWSAPSQQRPAIDPRLVNRKRVQDLVVINDALKAYHARHNAYPLAEGLAGVRERGVNWIAGLAPDFLSELPRDPAQSNASDGPQYVYASNGTDYKLLAQNVSLIGGTNVEVLGVRIDPTRQPTPQNASFGFWTEGFAGA